MFRSVLSCVLLLGALCSPLRSQDFRGEAFSGEPYGVCRVEYRGPLSSGSGSRARLEELRRASVTEAKGRVLYPACRDTRMESSSPEAKPVLWFLFHGAGELELTLNVLRVSGAIRIQPKMDELRRTELLKEWWIAYEKQPRDYDPTVEMGLAALVGRRLGLSHEDMPSLKARKTGDFEDVFGLLLGTESIRLAMQTSTLLNSGGKPEPADQPLPEAVAPPVLPVPAFQEVSLEPIALRVPRECFYLRCGRFDDFLWMRRLVDRWGAEFRNVFSARSADYGMSARLEHQLALHETELSRRFGGAVVKDIALLGTDTFFREGSAVGLLFQARNNSVLRDHFEKLRREVRDGDPSVLETQVQIAGRSVSLLSRPGNAVRSFYVQDGDYHLVTNSAWIAEAFLTTATQPDRSLGALKEFRYARSRVPVSEEGAFLYLSDPFFRHLMGPAYRVEMTRRSRSTAELQLLLLARLATRAEGMPQEDLESLRRSGFLPEGFGCRADGSALKLEGSRAWDTLRGDRGSFLPVPDVTVGGLTASEVEAYGDFAEAYRRVWTNMDPVFGTLRRVPSGQGLEKVALQLHISPYAKSRYSDLERILGIPLDDRLVRVKGDLLTVEVSAKIQDLILGHRENGSEAIKAGRQQRYFAGLRDVELPARLTGGEVVRERDWFDALVSRLRGYIGQNRTDLGNLAHALELEDEKKDARGYTRLNENFRRRKGTAAEDQSWARVFKDFFVAGTGRKLLEQVTPQLRFEAAEMPAQLRLSLGNLGASRLGASARIELYARDRQSSAGGALLLQSVQRNLRVEDPLAVLNELQGLKLQCPLGGTYVPDKGCPQRWISTAWTEDSLAAVHQVPAAYRNPLLDWIRALRLDFNIDAQALQTRIELETKN